MATRPTGRYLAACRRQAATATYSGMHAHRTCAAAVPLPTASWFDLDFGPGLHGQNLGPPQTGIVETCRSRLVRLIDIAQVHNDVAAHARLQYRQT